MSNSQLRIVPHRSSCIAREILTRAEQETNFLVSFQRFIDSRQKYVLIILGRYHSMGSNGQNVVRRSGSDLDHYFGTVRSVAAGICLLKTLLLAKKSDSPGVQTIISVNHANVAGINF